MASDDTGIALRPCEEKMVSKRNHLLFFAILVQKSARETMRKEERIAK
jgi:hypothetical protein